MKGYIFFYLSLTLSCLSDVLIKFLTNLISNEQIIFLRSLSSLIIFFCYLYVSNNTISLSLVKTRFQDICVHILRSILLFGAFFTWNLGLNNNKVSTVTVFNFFIPSIILVLSALLLKERIGVFRWLLNLIILSYILVIIDDFSIISFTRYASLLVSVILFSLSDILNKIVSTRYNLINITFYPFLILSFITLPFSLQNWISLSFSEGCIILLLGISSCFTLLFLLMSFKEVMLSSLVLHRYLELPLSILLSWIVLGELPDNRVILCAVLIFLTSSMMLWLTINKKTGNL